MPQFNNFFLNKHMFKRIFLFAVILLCALQAHAVFKVGDRVQARLYYSWKTATVAEVGAAGKAGQYMVNADDRPNNKEWLTENDLKPMTREAQGEAAELAAKRNQMFKVGERVMANNFGWKAGAVMEIGSGKNVGYFLIKHGDSKIPQWYSANNLKPVAEQDREDTAVARALATGPRAGKYGVWSYGAKPLYFGHFELYAGGRYKYWRYGREYAGDGAYRYDAGAKSVVWLSGPFHDNKWEGAFKVRAGGKVHTVHLTRTVEGGNSQGSN